MSLRERSFRTMDYESQEKGSLTEKQYLVYAFLLSISKWNPTERHYYVYKNSFKVKEAADLLGISQPTWRAALKKLEEELYIKLENDVYYIYFSESYTKLDIVLIKFLVKYSKTLKEEFGGIMPALYCVIAKYWMLQYNCGEDCIVTLSQLSNLFFGERTKEHLRGIYVMLSLFKELGLMYITEVPQKVNGISYTGYRINYVEVKPSQKLIELEQGLEQELDKIEQIINEIREKNDEIDRIYNKIKNK